MVLAFSSPAFISHVPNQYQIVAWCPSIPGALHNVAQVIRSAMRLQHGVVSTAIAQMNKTDTAC
jgi:hypothetical protein